MKQGKRKLIAFGEMFLLVSMSFAVAFMLSESIGGRVDADAMSDAFAASAQTGGGPPVQTGGGGLVGNFNPNLPTQNALAPPPATLTPAGAGTFGGAPGGVAPPDGPLSIGTTVGGASVVPAGTQIVAGSVIGPGSVLQSGTATLSNGVVLQAGQAVPNGMTATLASNGVMGGSGGSVSGAGSTLQTFTGGPAAGGGAGADLMGSIFGGKAFGAGVGGALFSGLVWGAIAGGIAYFVAGMFGQTKKQAESIGLGVGAGAFVGSSLYLYGSNYVLAYPGAQLAFYNTAFGAAIIGIGVAAVIIIMTYKKEKKELVRFECQAWEPPTGGSRCDDCNNNPLLPCSEYRCRSLGQACEIANPGTTEEKCFWKSKGDTSAPHMVPWDEALSPDGLKYYPDAEISPPNRGFVIKDSAGSDTCLPAFSNLEFGVKTDEPAQCRVDYSAKNTYSEMQFLLGESGLFLEEHTQRLKVPNTQQEGDVIPEIGVDGTFKLWVRCIDSNGNGEDSAAVAFSFCVDKGPDTTQPTIEGSSIESGMPVQFDVDAVPIEIYVNEPSECKWSRLDKVYSDMENVMECGTDNYQINADLNYVCNSQLTGVVNRQDNWFYFRCEDTAGNVMVTSYPLLLKGTEELVITKTGPTGEFTGSTNVIPVTLEVETAHGANNGVAACSFSNSENGRFIIMDNTENSYIHNQTLDLSAGQQAYYFRCIDAGGNLATSNTSFKVTTDTTDPLVTRVFKDGNSLKVITSEEAKCYYSNTNCDYNLADGLVMLYEDATKRNVHTVEWSKTATYYIKCEDLRGNQPSPNECQIVAKASEM